MGAAPSQCSCLQVAGDEELPDPSLKLPGVRAVSAGALGLPAPSTTDPTVLSQSTPLRKRTWRIWAGGRRSLARASDMHRDEHTPVRSSALRFGRVLQTAPKHLADDELPMHGNIRLETTQRNLD